MDNSGRIDASNLSDFVNETNRALGDFVDTFRYARKKLCNAQKASTGGFLFKFSDENRNWAINEGGGTEIQYHLYLRDGEVGYGLGFNTQYVPFANKLSPIEYMQPFVDAYLQIRNDDICDRMRQVGFSWLAGNEEKLHSLQDKNYYLFGKTISVDNGTISADDFNVMIEEMKGIMFDLYKEIFKLRNELVERKKTEDAMKKQIQQYVKLLNGKKNLILQGAPGTGKTYSTREIAVALCEEEQYEKLDALDAKDRDSQIKDIYKRLVEECRVAFTTFHQSMDYENFIEGLRPEVTAKGDVVYKIEKGIFKKIADKARGDKGNNYLLIIDEINRGNISKILGELITLLEASKREGEDEELKAKLPYSKEEFGVPSNLYILGTMNTTDRSAGQIDYAIRRRFAFVTLKAEKSVIENNISDSAVKDKALNLFDKVSEFIKANKSSDEDFDDLMVGHSYFIAKTMEKLDMKMKYEVLPLLKEYKKDGLLGNAEMPTELKAYE